MLRLASAMLGVLILAVVFYDVFQSVVLPRPSVGKLRLAPWILRPLWRSWRWLGTRDSRMDRRENWLGTFGPVGLIALLGFWALSIILGYALIFDSIPGQIRPSPADFWTSLYFSASTLLPLSYGAILPIGPAARVVVLTESASGLGLIALVISLLFSLYGSFQRREELVVTLDAIAGAPPAGLQILETVANQHMPDELRTTFDDWRRWSAAVLESHLAYPILVYFRSSHDNEAWLNSFGAVMDAATLVMSTVVGEDETAGHARMMFKVGNHLVEDLAWYFRFKNAGVPIVEREEFEDARERLIRAGFQCREGEEAWKEFSSLRSMYASPLNQLARLLAILPARWIGDRSYLPHSTREPSLTRTSKPRR
jgi:Ion channel